MEVAECWQKSMHNVTGDGSSFNAHTTPLSNNYKYAMGGYMRHEMRQVCEYLEDIKLLNNSP